MMGQKSTNMKTGKNKKPTHTLCTGEHASGLIGRGGHIEEMLTFLWLSTIKPGAAAFISARSSLNTASLIFHNAPPPPP